MCICTVPHGFANLHAENYFPSWLFQINTFNKKFTKSKDSKTFQILTLEVYNEIHKGIILWQLRERERERERERDRQTDRHRQTDRQREREGELGTDLPHGANAFLEEVIVTVTGHVSRMHQVTVHWPELFHLNTQVNSTSLCAKSVSTIFKDFV